MLPTYCAKLLSHPSLTVVLYFHCKSNFSQKKEERKNSVRKKKVDKCYVLPIGDQDIQFCLIESLLKKKKKIAVTVATGGFSDGMIKHIDPSIAFQTTYLKGHLLNCLSFMSVCVLWFPCQCFRLIEIGKRLFAFVPSRLSSSSPSSCFSSSSSFSKASSSTPSSLTKTNVSSFFLFLIFYHPLLFVNIYIYIYIFFLLALFFF